MRNRSILLVEDERASRRALACLLKNAGYDIRAAGSAEEALELLEAGDFPDVALVDLNLPGMDGLQLIAHLQGQDADLFIVLITANDSPDLLATASEVAYMRKPINFGELLQLISGGLSAA